MQKCKFKYDVSVMVTGGIQPNKMFELHVGVGKQRRYLLTTQRLFGVHLRIQLSYPKEGFTSWCRN